MSVPYTFANSVGNIPLAYLDANFSNVKAAADTAGTVTTAAQPNITLVGTLSSLTVTGNVTAANFTGNISGNISNAVYAESSGTVTTAAQPNITSVGTMTVLTASGNIRTTTGAFVGNAAGLTSIPGANVTGTVANATYATSAGLATTATSATTATTATSATTAGTVTTATQPNITSIGTLSSLTVTGNVTADNFIGNISGSISNAVFATTAGTVTTAAQPNITSVGTLSSLAVTANVNAGNLIMGAGSIFYGDFSAPIGNGRTVFQTSNTSTSGFTSITAIPGENNTLATASAFTAYLSTDVANSAWCAIQQANTDARINASKNGTGSYLPLFIYTSDSPRVVVDINGNVGIGNGIPLDSLSVAGNAYVSGNITAEVTVKTTPVPVSSLPSAATVGAGARAFVTDADAVTFGNLAVGGGSYYLPVFSNGTNWYLG